MPFPPHEPADAATIASVTATVREFFACLNAGDVLRFSALISDRLIATGGYDIDPETLESPPTPLPSEERVAFLGVFYVRQFADGRAGAIIAGDDPLIPSPIEPLFLIFVKAGDRWLVDEWPNPFRYELSEEVTLDESDHVGAPPP